MSTESIIPILSEYELTLLSEKNTVIAIALDENDDSDINLERYDSIKNAAIYFYNVKFVLLDQYSIEYLTKEQEVSIPAIFYIKQGEIIGCYSYPESETMFLYLCDLITKPETRISPINSLSELYCSLTDNPFTIISPPNLYNRSMSLQMQLGRDLGFIDVKSVSSSLLSDLGLSSQTVAFFRKEDRTVLSTQCDLDSLREATLPVYRVLMPSDIVTSSSKFVFSLFSDFLNDEEDDFLYRVGEKYSESVIVGYGINIEEYAAKFVQGVGGNEFDQILVFNYEGGFFYNASKYFDVFMGNQFTASDWFDSANKMIEDILNGVISPIYLSEEIVSSEKVESKYLQKVVGKNYVDFVQDSDHDVVLLYIKDGCQHCHDFFPVFAEFAEECISKENLTFLKFGFIDIEKNSSPKKFPLMIGVPHCHFFPAKNKSNDHPIRGGRDRDALIRLIKENSDRQIPFDAKPADKAQLAMEMMQMLMMADQIPEDEKENLIADMNKLADSLKDTDELNIDKKNDENNDITKKDNRKEIRDDML